VAIAERHRASEEVVHPLTTRVGTDQEPTRQVQQLVVDQSRHMTGADSTLPGFIDDLRRISARLRY
jgi:hypothetical protein